MNSHEVFIHIYRGCFAGTGAIVRWPQCQWSKPDGNGKISQCITTTKHSKAKTVCIFLGIYCISVPWLLRPRWYRQPCWWLYRINSSSLLPRSISTTFPTQFCAVIVHKCFWADNSTCQGLSWAADQKDIRVLGLFLVYHRKYICKFVAIGSILVIAYIYHIYISYIYRTTIPSVFSCNGLKGSLKCSRNMMILEKLSISLSTRYHSSPNWFNIWVSRVNYSVKQTVLKTWFEFTLEQSNHVPSSSWSPFKWHFNHSMHK